MGLNRHESLSLHHATQGLRTGGMPWIDAASATSSKLPRMDVGSSTLSSKLPRLDVGSSTSSSKLPRPKAQVSQAQQSVGASHAGPVVSPLDGGGALDGGVALNGGGAPNGGGALNGALHGGGARGKGKAQQVRDAEAPVPVTMSNGGRDRQREGVPRGGNAQRHVAASGRPAVGKARHVIDLQVRLACVCFFVLCFHDVSWACGRQLAPCCREGTSRD